MHLVSGTVSLTADPYFVHSVGSRTCKSLQAANVSLCGGDDETTAGV